MGYKKYLHVFKHYGWKVNITDKEIEIENWSPAGENLVEYLDKKIDIPSQMQKIADNFDADEHAEMWIEHRGKNGVPGSITPDKTRTHKVHPSSNCQRRTRIF